MTGVAPGTWRYAAPPLLLSVPAAVVAFPVGLALFVLGLAVVAFFRDPERTPPESGIVAPAHGKVSVIRKDSDRNERVDVDFGTHEVSFIAGWFARRIHPYVGGGEAVARGQRLGHIAFGSRADVLLPEWVDVEDVVVEKGQRVRAGETVVVETPGADE